MCPRSLFNCAACVQLSHALGCHMTLGSHLVKMQTKLSSKSPRIGEKRTFWMNEHGPADRGRSLCRESAEDYCSLQLRDGTEATEANMTPVIRT